MIAAANRDNSVVFGKHPHVLQLISAVYRVRLNATQSMLLGSVRTSLLAIDSEVTPISNDWRGWHNEPLSPQKAWNITRTKESWSGWLYKKSPKPQ